MIIINIFYNEKDKAFKLRANNTDYMMKVCEEGYLAHVYYGNKVPDEDLTYLLRLDESPFTPATNDRDRASFMDTLPFEYPCFGLGDYRESAFKIMDANGMSTCDLRYVSHKMYEGKPKLEGLPATFATEESGCSTLEITMYDKYADIEVVLIYTAFDKLDVITRSAVITNKSEKPFKITRALSACVDFDTDKMDMITLNGSWARERAVERCRLHHGKQLVDSCRGESSHQNNPFVALCDNNADEDKGEVFGFNFVYSGNFYAQAEVTQHKKTRFLMGINPLDFEWLLEKGESFACPEVVMVHSDEGIGKMSRTFAVNKVPSTGLLLKETFPTFIIFSVTNGLTASWVSIMSPSFSPCSATIASAMFITVPFLSAPPSMTLTRSLSIPKRSKSLSVYSCQSGFMPT